MQKKTNPTSAGTRHYTKFDRGLTSSNPEKSLTLAKRQKSGRNAHGHVTTRHRGGGAKRRLRLIDFKRNKPGVEARIVSLEYDPNRSANIALLYYRDGEKRYILAPDTLAVNDLIVSGSGVEPKIGNAYPLKKSQLGSPFITSN